MAGNYRDGGDWVDLIEQLRLLSSLALGRTVNPGEECTGVNIQLRQKLKEVEDKCAE